MNSNPLEVKSFLSRTSMMVAAVLAASLSTAQTPETSGDAAGQTAADLIRAAANTDGAFLAAGLLRTQYDRNDLASLLQYPTDTIVIVNLTGAQIKQAFERSVSLFPQPNSSFLQISGFEVTFNRGGPPNERVTNITVRGSRLEPTRTYTVAMPQNLGRGGLGYFKIWDKSAITRSLDDTTLESILKGKPVTPSPSRWVAAS